MLRLKKSAAAKSRRGNVTILVTISISLLVGIVALTLDGGLLQDNKRRLQNAADGAALAAANKIFINYPTIASSNNADPGGQASAAAFENAGHNGFPHNGADTTVVVNIPPQSGPFATKLGYAEVIITYKQPRYFSTIWGSTSTPVVARAVAKGYWGGTGNGVILLDLTVRNALDASGNGAMTVTGGASVIVDSNHPESAARETGNGVLTASKFEITGGYSGSLNGNVVTGVLPTPDPLAYLPVPSVPPNGTITTTSLGNGNFQYVLTPGRHSNLPSVQTGDIIIFKQASYNNNGGIYYIDGGGFTSQGGTILMDPSTTGGIMIYNNSPPGSTNSHGVGITGNEAGTVNLSAVTSGPYAGMLLWQSRPSPATMTLAGNGSFNLKGTVYAPNANLQVSGNGSATIGSQYVSRTLNVSGNGNINIDYTDEGTARKREVRLVE